MHEHEQQPVLSVIVTVVSGRESLRKCLTALRDQQGPDTEIMVPYDEWCHDVSELSAEFPDVQFHAIRDLGQAADAAAPAHQHRLYDRRRAFGLAQARGRLIAITEDHA